MVFTEVLNFGNKNDSAIKIGNALMDKDYYLKIADESVYRFMGEFASFPITKNIHPDYLDDFKTKVNNLHIGERDYIILKIWNTSNISRSETSEEGYVIPENQYITAVIFMEKGFATAKNLNFTNIEIYDILYLYNCAKNLISTTKKYTSFLELFDDLYFEYRSKDKIISFFNFKNGKAKVRYKDTLDNMVKKINDTPVKEDIVNINKLIFDIENFSNSFFYIIKSNVFSKTNDFEKISIKGLTVNKGSDYKSVIGIIKNSYLISSSDLDFLENRANLDSLTGLLNKKAITEAINLEFKSESLENLSLIMMDIDYFKDINDNYGHMFGDEVLTTVASILKEVIGNRGIVGRFGGDEFLIAVKNLNSKNELRSVLKSIRSKIEWAYLGQIKISTSLGTASYPKDANNYETLLKLADKCLYIAKEKGRNRFIIYSKDIHETLSSVDLSSKAIQLAPKMSLTQKSKHICSILEKIEKKESMFSIDDITQMADTIKDYYLFDKCMIFYNNKTTPIYSLNTNKNDLKIITLLDGYKNIFNERDMLIIGNYISVESKNAELYKFLFSTKNYSTIQYLIKDNNENIKGLIFISTYNHSNKWSEIDINYLAIIFKIISRALINSKSF